MGSSGSGFRVEDGAYESFAGNIDPIGDEFDKAAKANVTPHASLAGDGFSAMGSESGLTSAYGSRMNALDQRMTALGQKWRNVAAAALRTRDNYQAMEQDHAGVMRDIGKALE